MNIVYLFEASNSVGLGHCSRATSLARSLISNFHNCTLVTLEKNFLDNKYSGFIKRFNINFENFCNLDYFETYLKQNSFDYVILDFANQKFNNEDALLELINEHSKLVCIDDITKRRLKAKINFYPPIEWIKDENWKNFKGENYFGIEFSILKPELEFYKSIPQKSQYKYKFCITMGGSDPNETSIYMYKLIRKIFPYEKLVVILGPLCNKQNSFFDENTSTYINPENFLEIINYSENVITSFGITMYELYFLRKRTFYICSKEDHILSSLFFQKLENFEYLGFLKELNENEIIKKLKNESNNFKPNDNFSINDRIINILQESLSG